MFSLQRPTQRLATDRHPRRSFTLIELLMVIVIIGILMSLALAAFNRVMITAKVAEVKVEISGLNGALADFKAKFGFYPPSGIVLYVTEAGWVSDSRSRAVIRRMFPQFDFKGNLPAIRPGGAPWTTTKTLTGAECLVFFLGGVQQNGVPIGFSTNPLRPFLANKGTRIGPFFNFNASPVKTIDVDNDGMNEFVSPLPNQTTPYLYVSAYEGRGYVKIDLNVYSTTSPNPNPNPRNMTNVYLQGSTPWNTKSFQIICAGFDNRYGQGGTFAPDSAEEDLVGLLREAELDNITNFHTGMLAP